MNDKQPATSPVAALADLSVDQQRQIRDRILIESAKPLTVAIMGQTGAGKSSLLNALFGTNLEVGEIRPCTKIPEPVKVHGASGHPITFWDMPGIGESDAADQLYLRMYRQKLAECDIVLWAIHADTRSTLFDAGALRAMIGDAAGDERGALIAKISFVLTKVDLLTPPPWIYLRDGEAGSFAPGKKLRDRMTEKTAYFQEVLVKPYGGLGATSTYMSDDFRVDDPLFDYDDDHITYRGFMSESECARRGQAHPRYAAVFERLRDNQRVIPCSALFRYNLIPLLVAIVNKLGESAIGRFQRLVDGTGVTADVPVSDMARCCNLVVWDKREGRNTFDLTDLMS